MRVLLGDRALISGYTLGLAAGLRSSGVEAWIGGPADLADNGVTVLYPRADSVDRRLLKICEGLTGTARCHQILARHPHLLHLQWPTTLDATYALAAKRVYGIPLVYTVHNVGRATDPAPYEIMQRRFIALADLVLTHGPAMREAIVAASPRAASKTHVVEHGNHEHVISRFPRTQARLRLSVPVDGPLYTFVGQLRPRKGVDFLLTAFLEHRRLGGTGHLLIAGTATMPGYYGQLRQIAQEHDAPIHWLVADRSLAQRALDLAVSAATQVILPFDDASQSGSVIMAMTHGRCVVSTDVGEVGRTLRGRGLVIAPRDHDGLLRALAIGERDPAHCDQLGACAREYALTELAWPRIAARTAALYGTVEGGARRVGVQ
jgi:glycosyltransferase involved in cell wall biosynthesis